MIAEKWEGIHQDFGGSWGEYLKKKWEDKGFDYQETKSWIKSVYLKPNEHNFAWWLKNEKKRRFENTSYDEVEKLRKNLKELVNFWEKIDCNFSSEDKVINWIEKRFTKEDAEYWIKNMGLSIDECGFAFYCKKIKDSKNDLSKVDLPELREEYYDSQKWLNRNYSEKERVDVRKIIIVSENLEGNLNLKGFINLEELHCIDNNIVSLDCSDCSKLKILRCQKNNLSEIKITNCSDISEIRCNRNKLTSLDFLNDLSKEKIEILSIANNNFSETSLEVFSNFINLKNLGLGNWSEESIKGGIYNRFVGSLESLEKLNKLEELDIVDTDIESGLEFLTSNIKIFYCSSMNRQESKVKNLSEELNSYGGTVIKDNDGDYNSSISLKILKEWMKRVLTRQNIKKLKESEVKVGDFKFADYLSKIGYEISIVSKEDIKEKYLDYLQCENWLNFNYSKEERSSIKKLTIDGKKTSPMGDLDLREFSNLEELDIQFSWEITSCNISELSKLNKIAICQTQIKDLDFSSIKEKITELDLTDCNFSKDLQFFSNLLSLESLSIGNYYREVNSSEQWNNGVEIRNKFEGSLEPLKNLTKLKSLIICNTDINSGLEHLPESLEVISYEFQLKTIENYLDIFSTKKKLANKYPDQNVTEISFSNSYLKGCLDLSSYQKLKNIYCSFNQLTELNLNNSFDLENLNCSCNNLTNLNFIPQQLKKIDIGSNNFDVSLESLAEILPTSLEELYLGNYQLAKIKKGIYNKFGGSLQPLAKLNNLRILDITSTGLNKGLEYLPISLETFFCNGKVAEELELNNCVKKHGNGYNLSPWRLINNELIIEKSQQIIDYSNIKPKVLIDLPEIYKDKVIQSEIINHDLNNLDYSKFLLRDSRPFNLEINKQKQLPLRLYNLMINQVDNSTSLSNNTNYLTLSYCWGTDWEKKPQNYGQEYVTDLTKLGRKALNKVISTWKLLKEQDNLNINHIWIDNFCINQTNKEEKGREVAKQQIYYGHATTTLIAIDAEIGNVSEKTEYETARDCLAKVIQSPWFNRSWTFQEGLLSKQTIFMFDDALIDGRKLAQTWNDLKRREEKDKLGNNSEFYQSHQICITPLGWSYGATKNHSINLTLWEAMLGVKHRKQTVAIDKIYSILGLLPYGDKVEVKYKPWDQKYTKEDLEDALMEIIYLAMKQGYGKETLLTWSGHGNTLTFQEIVEEDFLEAQVEQLSIQ